MLPEWLESVLTPSSRPVRALGYLRELRSIRRRYRVWHSSWEPHCRRSRETILAAVSRTARRRKAVLLGSGYLHDVPLDQLAGTFREVILVDVLHPLATRWKTRRYRNVHLLATDVTGTLEGVWRAAQDPKTPLPDSKPDLFLDDPDIDLVASINLLSQLPCMPERYLLHAAAHSHEAILAYCRNTITAHLAWLQQLPGVVALIADTAARTVDTAGQVVRQSNTLYDLPPPSAEASWTWPLVPRSTVAPYHATHLHVVATPDFHSVMPTSISGTTRSG